MRYRSHGPSITGQAVGYFSKFRSDCMNVIVSPRNMEEIGPEVMHVRTEPLEILTKNMNFVYLLLESLP